MNIKKTYILIGIFLSCQVFYGQETKEKVSLVKIIGQLEKKFQCHFSYADENVVDVFIPFPPNYSKLEEYVSYLDENTNLDFKIIENNIITISLTTSKRNVCGYLYDKDTREPIENAVFQSKNMQTVTDELGFFELNEITKNELISIKHLGYKTVTYLPNKFEVGKCNSFYLVSKTEYIKEVIIRNYLTKGIKKKIDGSYEINYKNFGILPGLIETDVLQSLQAIPGVKSVDETITNINIRGGAHHENLILWDGVKMYQSGHFFGLISAFNPHLTKKVVLLKNGTTANLSDGVSGTILMFSDNQLNHTFKSEIGQNLINTDVFFDVPINQKSSIQIAARKSISDFLKTPTYNSYFDKAFENTEVVSNTQNVISFNDNFSFNDISARLLYQLTDKDMIRVNLLNVNNKLSFLENSVENIVEESKESKVAQNNLVGSIFYNRIWNQNFTTNLQIYATKYLLNSTNNDILNNQRLKQENEVIEESLKINTKYHLNDRFLLNNSYQFIETGVTNIQDVDNPLFYNEVKEVIREHGLSSQINYQTKNKKTTLTTGLRLNYIEKFSTFFIEPRFNIYYQFNKNFSFELLGEMKHQTTTQVVDFQNDFLGVENRRWLLSNNIDVPIVKSKQASIGMHYTNKGLLITTEGYYKHVDGITSQSQGFQNQYQYVKTTGSYNSLGFDFLINKRFKNSSLWFNYSFGNNQYKFKDLTEMKFPTNFDITHSISIASSFEFKQIKFSGGLNWHTGRPTTPLVMNNQIIDGELNYLPPNSSRLKDYMRVDFSAQYNFKISRKVKGQAGVAFWNVLNKKSELNKYFEYQPNNNMINNIVESSLSFTPNVSFRVSF